MMLAVIKAKFSETHEKFKNADES